MNAGAQSSPSWVEGRRAGLLATVLISAAASAAEPTAKGKLGEAISVAGYRVTLLSIGTLGPEDRKTDDGVAPGGRRMVWLIEPPEGSTAAPVFSDVRLRSKGAAYNKVTSALSNKPGAPDLIVHDYVTVSAEGRPWFVAARHAVGRNGVVAEVLIRGPEIPRDAEGTAEIRVGLPQGAKTKFVWVGVPFGQTD